MFIPIISGNSQISVGSYKIVYKIKEGTPALALEGLPIISNKKEVSILGKKIVLQKTELQAEKGLYNIYIDVLSNPIPLVYLVSAILFVLGLGITYLIFDKIYTLVDDSKIIFTFIAVTVFLFALVKALKVIRK